MKKQLQLVALGASSILLLGLTGRAMAYSGYFGSKCGSCHTNVISTCGGCHAHGTHPYGDKTKINLAAKTDKDTYHPGEDIKVTISGGYKGGWVRAYLYSTADATGDSIAKSTGPNGIGGGSSLPITFTVPAPKDPGTYTYSASWYGNKYDTSGAAFVNWKDDPKNANHGEEWVKTNTFTVVAPASATEEISKTENTFVAKQDNLKTHVH